MPRNKKSAKGAINQMSRDHALIAPAADTIAGVAATGALSHCDQVKSAAAPVPNASVGGLLGNMSTHGEIAAALAPTIAEIKHWHRQRVFAMDQRKRSDLALGAFMRTQLGWSRTLPKAEGDKIAKRAADLVSLGEKVAKGKETGIGDSVFGQWSTIILASIHGRAHWNAIESTATKEMEQLATSLPVWAAFGEGVKGFGPRSLAVIVGEAGDIGSYATVAKLWKRMGLAVMNGVRQGGLRKTASADEWVAHGYSARRRSYMFVIGDVLVKNKGYYRDVYLARKEYEREQAGVRGLIVAPAARIPAARKAEFISDGHIHKRSQRYMEKRVLKHLWQAWRRTNVQTDTGLPLSAAELEQQTNDHVQPGQPVSAARSAMVVLPSNELVPSASTRQTADQMKPNPVMSGKRRTNPKVTSSLRSSAERSAKVQPSTTRDVPSATIPAKVGKRRASHALSSKGKMPAAKSNEKAHT